jgi:hypothetical protein
VTGRKPYLDGTRIYYTLFVAETLSDGIFRYHGLPSTSVSRDKDALISLYSVNGDFLERIEDELVLSGGVDRWDVFRYRNVVVSRRDGDLVADLKT